MRYTIEETERRRKIQEKYNREHSITPRTIISAVKDSMQQHLHNTGYTSGDFGEQLLALAEELPIFSSLKDLEKEISKLEKEMHRAAGELAFEKAAELRDRIKKIRLLEIELG
jgi:excinuclease ABC subunit B